MIDQLYDSSSPHYSPSTAIFLVTCPPLDYEAHKKDLETRLGPGFPVDRTEERTATFAAAAAEVAAVRGVSLVNAHAAILAACGSDSPRQLGRFLSDGLHLTSEGYSVRLSVCTGGSKLM